MSAKNRHIAAFESVATIRDLNLKGDINTDNIPKPDTNIDNVDNTDVNNVTNTINDTVINPDNNTVIDNDINHNVNHNNAIDTILNTDKSKSTRVQRGLYLDRDIDAVLTKLLKKGGKGAKSDVINDVLRAAFEARGLLK